MSALVAAKDWSATPLGARSAWSPSLKMAVDIIMASGFPMALRWGPDFVLIYNDAYRPILGDKHPWALGLPARDAWAEVWDQIEPFHTRILSGESDAVFARDMLLRIRRHGDVWEDARFTLSYSPIPDAAAPSGIGGVFVTAVETTDRVEADRKHAAERARMQRLFGQMPGFVAVLVGPDHVYEYVNDAYVALTGARDFSGRTVREVFPELEGQGFYELLDSVFDTGERYVARGIPVRLAGESEARFVDLLYEPMHGDDGVVTGIFVGGYDVTEIHRTADALRQSEARMRELRADLERKVIQRTQARGINWQISPDLMGALNSEGYFETSNPAWQTVLGWTEAEVASMSIFELLHPDDVETTRVGFAMTQIGEPAIQFPNRYRHKDGSYRWISWVGVPEDGYVYCTGRDITEERARQAELDVAREFLRQSQKLEAMGQLTGGVAHDFNNLLMPIIGGLDMLTRRGVGGDRERRVIEGALQSAERAKVLVQRLLAFARRQPLQATAVDLASLTEGMADLIASTTGPGILVRVDLADGLPMVRADAGQLEMAILNLAVNARDAMPDGGVLTLSADIQSVGPDHPTGLAPRDYVRLKVSDTGVGMDVDTLQRAIEPFFSTKGVGKGTGLGLSMVHGLASQLGGAMRLDSAPGRGTAVELWLRISSSPAKTPGADPSPGAAPSLSAVGTALVVDDEDLVRMSTADMLSDLGYAVVEARSAEEAIALFDQGLRPDVLVTDHLMPGKNGVELARIVKARSPRLPVLLVSGYAESEGIPTDLMRLTKPFRFAELATVLNAIMIAAARDG